MTNNASPAQIFISKISILVADTIGNPVTSAKVVEASAAAVDPLNLTRSHNRLADGWLADSDSTIATKSRGRSETSSSVRRVEEVLAHGVSAVLTEVLTEGDPRGEQWKEGRKAFDAQSGATTPYMLSTRQPGTLLLI